MYDNEIYGNINRDQTADNSNSATGNSVAGNPVTGNFSGASSPRDMGSVSFGNSSASSDTTYFNLLEPQREPQAEVQREPQAEVQAEAQIEAPAEVQTEAQTETRTETQTVVQTEPQRVAQESTYTAGSTGYAEGMTQGAIGGAQTVMGEVHSTESASRQTTASTGNTTWVQAPVRDGNRKEASGDAKPLREEKKLGLGQKIMLSISLGLFFGIFAGVGFYGVMQATGALQSNPVEITNEKPDTEKIDPVDLPPEEIIPQIQQAGSNIVYTGAQTNVSAIVKEVMPAMVSIINNYTEVTSFWGQTYRENLSASGSGIIVARSDTELLIVTNQHVVSDAEQLLVTLIDDTQVEAKIKGMDADMDLAVIAINLEDLDDKTLDDISIATLGDSDNLELGEQVIAIGNALGYGQSVTVGYISALDREIELDDGSIRSFIQTDAAINPGNSGGALLNAAGEVIGINSNKIGGSSIEGMGYAIPITAASPIIADLMERRTRNKVADSDIGYLGIGPQDVTDQISLLYGMPKGVYIASVQEGSAAENAGMVKGDVITKFDGNKITCYADLQTTLQYYASGDTVKVTVMRPENGEYLERELTLTLGKKPSSR
ncbi:MAG: trypsin-like peptidase domain-containing protein [Acetatifactor sp.]|nr:trypsin-like peptidase domain-containing protein [Acetatifactor sp.]